MSATHRRDANPVRAFVLDRAAARRIAFEAGVAICDGPGREAFLAEAHPWWTALARLTPGEREKVIGDVRAFSAASQAAQE